MKIPQFSTSGNWLSTLGARPAALLCLLRSPVSFLLCLLLLTGLQVHANTYNWSGNTSTAMSGTPANWGGTVPTATDIAKWDAASYTRSPSANADMTIGQLWFAAGNTGGVTFGNGANFLTLNGISGTGIQMDSGSGAVDTGNAKFKIGGDQAWTNNSTSLLTIGGTITNSGNTTAYTLTSGGSGDTTLGGIISDGGTVGTIALTKTGAGTLSLNGANTFTGGLTIQAGTVKLGATTGAGAGLVTLGVAGDATSGTLDLNGASRTIISLATAGTAANQIITNSAGTTATLNYTGAGNSTFGGVIQNGSGGNFTSVTLNNAAATLTLSGNNTYTGITTITAGTLSVNSIGNGTVASAIGASTNVGTNINLNGGTLQYTGGNTTTDRNFKISASSTIDTANSLTIGNIDNGLGGGGTGTLTKTGAGTLSTNDLRAGILVSAGTLAVNGGVSNSLLTVNGTTAVYNNTSGSTHTLTSIILDGGGSIIGSDMQVTNNNVYDVRSGSISANLLRSTSSNGSLTKTTSGTVTLSGNNSYLGATTISGGVLSVSSIANGGVASAIGKSSNIATNLVFDGGTLQYTGGNTTSDRAFTINAGKTAIIDTANNLSFAGATGAATNGALTKLGNGILTLTGNNTYTGVTTISGGALQFAKIGSLYNGTVSSWTAANIKVASGGTLALNVGGTNEFSTGNVTTLLTNLGGLNGTSTTGFASGSSIGFDTTNAAGNTFTVANNIADSTGSGGGAVGLTKLGTNTLVLTGNNTNTGNTTISGGILQFAKTGSLYNGTDSSWTAANIKAASGGTLALNVGGTNEFSTGNVTTLLTNLGGSNGTGTTGFASGSSIAFDTTNAAGNTFTVADNIADSTGSGGGAIGLTKLGTNTLVLTGNNTYTGATTISAGTVQIGNGTDTGSIGSTSAITNNGSLVNNVGSGNRTLNAAIGGTGSLTQNSTGGTLTLTGNNTYTGNTTISAGVLNIQSATALGTTANGTSVTSGAALQIQGNSTVGAEALALSGTGISNDGALRNISGNNTYNGTVTLGSATRINSDAGALTLGAANSITGTQNLTLGGAGNGTVSGTITTSTGSTLTKDGSGTWTLSGANNYTGNTTISTGVLNIQNATALGTTAGGTTVAGGAALQMQNNITVGAETLSLNGTGISNDGALRSISGNNFWQGTVTLTGATRVNSDAGLLTFNGAANTFTGAYDLTFGGGGNGSVGGTITIGTGSLTKDGLGTWTFVGPTTYTGNTTVSGGTLSLTGGSLYGATTNNATITIASGALLTSTVSGAHAFGYGANATWSVAGTINYALGSGGGNLPGSVILNNGTISGSTSSLFGTYILLSNVGVTARAFG